MRAHSILPVTVALAVGVSSWLGGCGNDDPDKPTTASSSTSSSGAGGNGAGGNGSGGAGGSVTPPPNDKCPGEAVTLNVGDATSIGSFTDTASDDYSAACGGAGAGDLVYAITLTGDGTFKAKVTATASSKLNPAIYLRSACEDDASNVQCADNGTGGVEFIAGELKANTYYLIVDGGAGSEGAFTLALSLSAPMCGDHVLNAGEACDPPTDGCDATCQFQAAPPAQDKCPAVGGTYQVPANGLTVPAQYTTGFTDDYMPMTCGKGGTGGPDRVYQLVPDIDGMMTVKLGYDMDGTTSTCDVDPENTGCFDRVLYVRTTCNDGATEIACANQGVYSPESITFPVTALNQYYVFVDGASPASYGAYSLIVSVQ